VVGATAGAAAGEATVVVGAGGEAVFWAFAYCFPALLVQLFGTCNSGGVPAGVIAAMFREVLRYRAWRVVRRSKV
jgi:hypothetical protein